LVYWWSCHQGIWSWVESTWDSYRFVFRFHLFLVMYGMKLKCRGAKDGHSKWCPEIITILFSGCLFYKLEILILEFPLNMRIMPS
jgi:hypothetical protein